MPTSSASASRPQRISGLHQALLEDERTAGGAGLGGGGRRRDVRGSDTLRNMSVSPKCPVRTPCRSESRSSTRHPAGEVGTAPAPMARRVRHRGLSRLPFAGGGAQGGHSASTVYSGTCRAATSNRPRLRQRRTATATAVPAPYSRTAEPAGDHSAAAERCKYARTSIPEQLFSPNPTTRSGLLAPFKPTCTVAPMTTPDTTMVRRKSARRAPQKLANYATIRGPSAPHGEVPAAAGSIRPRMISWIMRPDVQLGDDDRLALNMPAPTVPTSTPLRR